MIYMLGSRQNVAGTFASGGQKARWQMATGSAHSALERALAMADPGKLATIAYGLLPRDLFVRVKYQWGAEPEACPMLRRGSMRRQGSRTTLKRFSAIEEDRRGCADCAEVNL